MFEKERTVGLATPEAHARMLREMETIMNLKVQPVSFADIFGWIEGNVNRCIGNNSFGIMLEITRCCEGVCLNNWVKFALAALDFEPSAVTYTKGGKKHTVVPNETNLFDDNCDWVVNWLPACLPLYSNVRFAESCFRTRRGMVCNQIIDKCNGCKHIKAKTAMDYEWELKEYRCGNPHCEKRNADPC